MLERIKVILMTILLVLVFVAIPVFMLSLIPDLGKLTAVAHDAKVTDVHVYGDDDGGKEYRPTFTFTDSDHRTFKAESVVRYGQDFHVGEVYQVRYDPYRRQAGCLIVGDEDRLLGLAFSEYLFLFAVIALAAFLIWRWVRLRRTSGTSDEASE